MQKAISFTCPSLAIYMLPRTTYVRVQNLLFYLPIFLFPPNCFHFPASLPPLFLTQFLPIHESCAEARARWRSRCGSYCLLLGSSSRYFGSADAAACDVHCFHSYCNSASLLCETRRKVNTSFCTCRFTSVPGVQAKNNNNNNIFK